MGWFEERAGLDGTVAVITGGAGGLGTAIVEDLSANGVRPAVIDLDDSAVKELRDSLDKQGVDCIVTQGDVREPDALTALFEQVDERWGRVDTLVNIVGGTFRAQFVDTGAKGWDAILRTNLSHVLHACSLAVPRMQAGGRGGSIINLTTIEAHRAAPGFAVYSAAKAAVEQFARTLSIEVAPDGIRVNNVAPDYVPTPNLAKLASLGGGDSSLSTPDGLRVAIPMGRAGHVTDVSNSVVFLASKLSAFITGTTLHPDGGTFASSGWFNWPESGWANHVPSRILAGAGPADATGA
ncbi:SDR family oxidoreductase [Rhodococcus sp. HNM0563]|uniref:SDR family NAD(P)-dependent oxidoreductase n=1 Tax=unclassified Rhodococcus (in: high G+C Gram-positive bacteria) TaxID=192944 RepID=UPI00146B3606|nr:MULTISPECIES: SDR family oxidoreductase [unclassified Rhodococcus (in: high G+C Gram-positive bacteria)]MCK0093580.1 SDR family oxidoreductase [Rhodococcus sp. F64268]NLU65298.1 SDR family oxidoreductase [Rhodococcus sp. HNM0563]